MEMPKGNGNIVPEMEEANKNDRAVVKWKQGTEIRDALLESPTECEGNKDKCGRRQKNEREIAQREAYQEPDSTNGNGNGGNNVYSWTRKGTNGEPETAYRRINEDNLDREDI